MPQASLCQLPPAADVAPCKLPFLIEILVAPMCACVSSRADDGDAAAERDASRSHRATCTAGHLCILPHVREAPVYAQAMLATPVPPTQHPGPPRCNRAASRQLSARQGVGSVTQRDVEEYLEIRAAMSKVIDLERAELRCPEKKSLALL
jgi:hypothetical protein